MKRNSRGESESQQISSFANKKVSKGEGRRRGLWQRRRERERGKGCRDDRRKLKGTNSEERAGGDKGEDRGAVSGMREDDAVGGAKLQMHCAQPHLFSKENSGVKNERHAQMAHSFPCVLLLPNLSDALQSKTADGLKTSTMRCAARSAPNRPTRGRRNQ